MPEKEILFGNHQEFLQISPSGHLGSLMVEPLSTVLQCIGVLDYGMMSGVLGEVQQHSVKFFSVANKSLKNWLNQTLPSEINN